MTEKLLTGSLGWLITKHMNIHNFSKDPMLFLTLENKNIQFNFAKKKCIDIYNMFEMLVMY